MAAYFSVWCDGKTQTEPKRQKFSHCLQLQDQASHSAIDYSCPTNPFISWVRIWQEVKSLPTEEHTEAPHFLEEAPLLTMQAYTKAIKESGKFPKCHVCKEFLPPKHTYFCLLLPNILRDICDSVKYTQSLIWSHCCYPLLTSIWLQCSQTKILLGMWGRVPSLGWKES